MSAEKENPLVAARRDRTRWFLFDRFGMFIHWGLYAIPARGEWVRSVEKISTEAYQKYFDEFNPTNCHPEVWAKIARNAGMKYAVFTAKHHDGFCLFDSRLTDYKSTNTPARRDFVREYAEAFRAEGLKVGLYYSLLDWHHPDYPASGDRFHPMRDAKGGQGPSQDFSKYLDYLHGQVAELLTQYGRIDILWLDFSYDNMMGKAWRAAELAQAVRTQQPHILLNNRLGASGEGNRRFGTQTPEIFSGDFACPEQIIPPEGLVDGNQRSVPWEACLTLNKNWGYCAADRDFKSPRLVIHALVDCVSKNGNLLLNVGPNAKGEIPAESERILEEVGAWMRRNGESLYGCGQSEFQKPEWGRYTQKGNRLFAHIYERGIGPVDFRGLNGKIKQARMLADGSELRFEKSFVTTDYDQDVFIDFPSSSLPDGMDTVLEFELL